MTIGFTIPSSETYVSANTNIIPDKGMGRSSKPRIRVAKFGDGYEQRLVDGINHLDESYSVNFSNRTRVIIDDIMAFFDSRKGASFDFTIPDSNQDDDISPMVEFETTIRVVCEGYSLNYDNHPISYSCNATFRRVYEA